MLTMLLPALLGAGLTVIGHLLGSRTAAAAAKGQSDAFAGLPGLPGHPVLNAIGSSVAPAAPVVAPAAVPGPIAVPTAQPSPLAGLGPLVSTFAPFIEQELASLFAGVARDALARMTTAAAPAVAAKP